VTELKPDTDRPLENATDDKYGFSAIASKLASGVAAAVGGDGIVIGIEGPWGSGKTTLLNLLEKELKRQNAEHFHVVKIAPWMSGDQTNLVDALLSPIAEILERAKKEKSRFWSRDKGRDLAEMMSRYSIRTGRLLAPIARFAGNFIPGASIAAEAIDVGSGVLSNFGREATLTDLKARIATALSEGETNFVVIIDDLDRLDPSQVVEVVRLVRSVADFPKIAYILCYDRSVLSHALQNGLGVPNGDEFLQKIVQLTFAIPLPEPFDLRADFLQEARAIYEKVNSRDIEGNEETDFRNAVDREGAGLRTPREVKLALNGLRFTYPSLKDDVYFPDMCRLNLLKVTNPRLYRWIEEYLGLRSVLVTGDASVSNAEKARLGTDLGELLPLDDSRSGRSIWSLRRFLPGIEKADNPGERVFASSSYGEVTDLILQRRLGSPLHYRFYFALSPPKTVIPDAEFEQLLAWAGSDTDALVKQLRQYGSSKRLSGRNWFEYVLLRLDNAMVNTLDPQQCKGLVVALATVLDDISTDNPEVRMSLVSFEREACNLAVEVLIRLRDLDGAAFANLLDWLAAEAPAINWLYGSLFVSVLGEPDPNRLRFAPSLVLGEQHKKRIRTKLKERASAATTKARLQHLPRLSSYLRGWRDVSSQITVRRWVASFIKSDERFLWLLEQLRGWAMSDRVYYPLHRESVDNWMSFDQAVSRLKLLESNATHRTKAKQLLHAIELSRD